MIQRLPVRLLPPTELTRVFSEPKLGTPEVYDSEVCCRVHITKNIIIKGVYLLAKHERAEDDAGDDDDNRSARQRIDQLGEQADSARHRSGARRDRNVVQRTEAPVNV